MGLCRASRKKRRRTYKNAWGGVAPDGGGIVEFTIKEFTSTKLVLNDRRGRETFLRKE